MPPSPVESLATASAAASTGSAELDAGASGASTSALAAAATPTPDSDDDGGREEGPAAFSSEILAGIFPVSRALSRASSLSLVAAWPSLASERRSPAAASRASRRLGWLLLSFLVEVEESR